MTKSLIESNIDSLYQYKRYLRQIDNEIGERKRDISELICQRNKYQLFVRELEANIDRYERGLINA